MNFKQKLKSWIAIFRKIHRTLGASLFIVFLIISITGLLLGWKKNSNGYILAKTYSGVSNNSADWLSADSLQKLSVQYLNDSIDSHLSNEISRIEFRVDKGIVKVLYKNHFWALQIDATNGSLLYKERRRADFIEKLHDGSLLDFYAGTKNDIIKLIFTSIAGLALLTFTVTGFWLWYGPKLLGYNRRRINASKK